MAGIESAVAPSLYSPTVHFLMAGLTESPARRAGWETRFKSFLDRSISYSKMPPRKRQLTAAEVELRELKKLVKLKEAIAKQERVIQRAQGAGASKRQKLSSVRLNVVAATLPARRVLYHGSF